MHNSSPSMNSNRSDEELLNLYNQGSNESIGVLYLRHKDYFMNVVYSSTSHDKQTIEDIIQDAFIKVKHAIDSGNYTIQKGVAIRSWMVRVVINTSLDYHRDKKRLPSMPHSEEKEYNIIDIVAYHKAPDSVIINQERINQVKSLVERLSPKERYIVEQRFYYEKKFDDIANEINEKSTTCRGVMRRALVKLKNLQTTGDV